MRNYSLLFVGMLVCSSIVADWNRSKTEHASLNFKMKVLCWKKNLMPSDLKDYASKRKQCAWRLVVVPEALGEKHSVHAQKTTLIIFYASNLRCVAENKILGLRHHHAISHCIFKKTAKMWLQSREDHNTDNTHTQTNKKPLSLSA